MSVALDNLKAAVAANTEATSSLSARVNSMVSDAEVQAAADAINSNNNTLNNTAVTPPTPVE